MINGYTVYIISISPPPEEGSVILKHVPFGSGFVGSRSLADSISIPHWHNPPKNNIGLNETKTSNRKSTLYNDKKEYIFCWGGGNFSRIRIV